MTGWPVRIEVPKSPVNDVADIAQKLFVDGLVHAQALVDHFIGRLVGFLPDDGADRIDRHQAADAESQDKQAEQRDEDGGRLARKGLEIGGVHELMLPKPGLRSRPRRRALDGGAVRRA